MACHEMDVLWTDSWDLHGYTHAVEVSVIRIRPDSPLLLKIDRLQGKVGQELVPDRGRHATLNRDQLDAFIEAVQEGQRLMEEDHRRWKARNGHW